MSSIRPLITITIIVAVGVFFFTKINQGPLPLPAETDEALDGASLAEIPPLSPMTTAAAPAWNESQNGASQSVAAAPMAPPVRLSADIPAASTPQVPNLASAPAEVPPIPELPSVNAVADSNASPIPLPANIPVAQYPGDSTATSEQPAPLTTAQNVPMPVPVPDLNGGAVAPPIEQAVAPVAASDDRYGTISADDTTQTMPVAQAPTPAVPQTQPQPITPPVPQTPTYASEWPQIQQMLERQELVAAHEMLSRWYGNPNLTPAEAQQVELLLSQLAGTVVYSTEHRLEPPYTVHSGDTLQTIAQRYDVPWQLLAKINGIPAADLVQPGQQLKVVHGPFSAVVELDKSQLTLMLDGRYAGRFPISLVSGSGASEGQWVLEQKLVQPTTQESGVVSASYTATVDHVLVLRNESPTAAGETISITSGKPSPSGPTAVAPAAIRLSPRDVEEVADILSVGSPVMIRR